MVPLPSVVIVPHVYHVHWVVIYGQDPKDLPVAFQVRVGIVPLVTFRMLPVPRNVKPAKEEHTHCRLLRIVRPVRLVPIKAAQDNLSAIRVYLVNTVQQVLWCAPHVVWVPLLVCLMQYNVIHVRLVNT